MKILITGGTGFIGSFLVKNLEKNHEVFSPNSTTLPLTRADILNKYLKKHTKDKKFDLVIHTAYRGSNPSDPNKYNSIYPVHNIVILFNLLEHKKYYKKFINLGSGAEFDTHLPIHDEVNDLYNSFPLEGYALGKNVIARVIDQTPNCYNLRIFGCFGLNEHPTRFILKNLLSYLDSKPIEVYQDKFFDFFNIKDLLKVINYYIEGIKENYPLEKTIDLVYPEKIKLSDIAGIINNLSEKKVEIEIKKSKLGNSYTGSKLGVPYNIEFDGLVKGIRQMYNSLLKQKEVDYEL